MDGMRSSYSYDRGIRQTVDWWLVACYAALVVVGWISIYASIHSTEPSSIFDLGSRSGKQFLWMMVVFAVDLVILFVVNPKLWEVLTPPAYILILVLLVLVIFLSDNVKGSHSWFELGPVKFQPAEVSKITTSLMLALVMGRQGFQILVVRLRQHLMPAQTHPFFQRNAGIHRFNKQAHILNRLHAADPPVLQIADIAVFGADLGPVRHLFQNLKGIPFLNRGNHRAFDAALFPYRRI